MRTLARLLLANCIKTKNGGMNGFALVLLCVFGLLAIVVLCFGHPALLTSTSVGGGAAVIITAISKLIPK